MISTWDAPTGDGRASEELLVSFDQKREHRILVLPAWFDEANKLRRFTVEVMRRLDSGGIDSFLPDLPGCNESLQPLEKQSVAFWRDGAEIAVDTFKATHILSIRSGSLIAPPTLPGWRYAPQPGLKLLRGMIRARTIANREAGREETAESLMETGAREGLTLGGWSIGAEMFQELKAAEPVLSETQSEIAQADIGRAGLWLRAEPDYDADQADALAAIITSALDSAA